MNKDSTTIKPKFNLDELSKKKMDEHIKALSENPQRFPVEVFPEELRLIIHKKVEGCSYHQDYTAAAHLSAAATAIGAAVHSRFVGYNVTANLSMTLVGESGVNKSEPGKDAYKPLEERDNDNWREYEKEQEQHEVDLLRYTKKEIGEKPKLPVLKKWMVTDITLEALAQVCSNNKRGICSFVDEEAGRLKNMNRYNNGSDQEAYLSLWNGTSFNIDRATKKSIRVINPCVSTFGTIQPAVLDEFAKDSRGTNGYRDRILFVWPTDLKRPAWSRKRIDTTTTGKWFRIINKLIEGLNFTIINDKQAPTYIPFSPEAEENLIAWQTASITNDEEIGNNDRFSISAKIYIYTLRFALIIQFLRWACGEAEKNEIDAESARRAIKLAEYFREQALKVAAYINSRNPLDNLPAVKRELYLLLPKTFTTAQAKETNAAQDEKLRLPERTLDYWLSDINYFEKIKYGHYQKKY